MPNLSSGSDDQSSPETDGTPQRLFHAHRSASLPPRPNAQKTTNSIMNNLHVIPEGRRLQDMDGWLQTNGLGFPTSSHADWDEARQRQRETQAYADQLHQEFFREHDERVVQEENDRSETIQRSGWNEQTIHVHAADREIIGNVPLAPLASSCKTIFALASSWDSFAAFSKDEQQQDMFVSLENFPKTSVEAFLRLVLEKRSVESLSNDPDASNLIVDCCQMGHYLQNDTILDQSVAILMNSIDSNNCHSICQLADQLNLPQLLERSLGHMIQTLGEKNDNLSEAWEDLTPELRARIAAMKTALQSSVHDRTSRLYFGSLHEYISIFAERVQYFRERLFEAQEQLERIERGTLCWKDTHQKVQRQALRVQTLERVLREQKKVFLGK